MDVINNFFPQEGRSTSASRHALVWPRLRGRIRWWCAEDNTGRRTVWRGIARPSSFPTDTESTTSSSCSTTCIRSCSGSSSNMAFTSSTRFLLFLFYTKIQKAVGNKFYCLCVNVLIYNIWSIEGFYCLRWCTSWCLIKSALWCVVTGCACWMIRNLIRNLKQLRGLICLELTDVSLSALYRLRLLSWIVPSHSVMIFN